MSELPQPRPRPEIPEVEIERAALTVPCPQCLAAVGSPSVGSYMGIHGPVRAHYARMKAGNAIPPLPEMVEDGEWRYPANLKIEHEIAKFLLDRYTEEMWGMPVKRKRALAQIKVRRTIILVLAGGEPPGQRVVHRAQRG